MTDELTPEQREALQKAKEESTYSAFKGMMDRYIEEKKPAEDEKTPERTKKPGPSFFESLFGG